MAQYKQREYLYHSSSSAFDTRHAPSTRAQNPGIYRCTGCDDEVVIPKNALLPPADHHEHIPGLGKIEWQLLVFAQQSK